MTSSADWQGAVGNIWAEEWRRTDRSFAELAQTLDAAIQAAAPAGRGIALDVGCGAGATSIALAAKRPDLTVLGIDVCPELLDVARDRAERAGLANARFATADLNGALPDLPAPDLLFSRHGVMFAADPTAMFARLHALARPGAALVFSCFRAPALNPWAGELVAAVTGTAPAVPEGYVPGPFAFSDAEQVAGWLSEAGWQEATATPVDYHYVAGAGADPVADATAFLSRIGPAAAAIRATEDDPALLRDRLASALADHLVEDRVAFPAAAWLWSARA